MRIGDIVHTLGVLYSRQGPRHVRIAPGTRGKVVKVYTSPYGDIPITAIETKRGRVVCALQRLDSR